MKNPKIITQEFEPGIITHITGQDNVSGNNMAFKYVNPDELMLEYYKSTPFKGGRCVCTHSHNKVSFWSDLNIDTVVVHTVPNEVLENEIKIMELKNQYRIY